MVAIDSMAAELSQWYGHTFIGRKVKHILYSHSLGLGEIDADKMKIIEIET